MYKDKTENVEVYFICYKKYDMDLVEAYYDEVLNTHCWYFNAYLAYCYWKKKFQGLDITDISKMFLIIAASKYLIYQIENQKYKNAREKNKLKKELKEIQLELNKITQGDFIIDRL